MSNLVFFFLTHAVCLELALQATYARDCNDDDGDNMTVTTTNDVDEREDDDDRRCIFSMFTMPDTFPTNAHRTLTSLPWGLTRTRTRGTRGVIQNDLTMTI